MDFGEQGYFKDLFLPEKRNKNKVNRKAQQQPPPKLTLNTFILRLIALHLE